MTYSRSAGVVVAKAGGAFFYVDFYSHTRRSSVMSISKNVVAAKIVRRLSQAEKILHGVGIEVYKNRQGVAPLSGSSLRTLQRRISEVTVTLNLTKRSIEQQIKGGNGKC
jgi:hypothetical protein